jgi:hypothetical protein
MFCVQLEIVGGFQESQLDHSPLVIVRHETKGAVFVREKVVMILACLLAEIKQKLFAVRAFQTAAKNFKQGKENFSSVIHCSTLIIMHICSVRQKSWAIQTGSAGPRGGATHG